MARVLKQRQKLGRTFFKQWREHSNLTQEAAASRLDISRSMLSKIENGQQPYTQIQLELAAEAYGTDPASILMRNPKDKAAPFAIANKLVGVTAAKREMIEAVIDTMLKAG